MNESFEYASGLYKGFRCDSMYLEEKDYALEPVIEVVVGFESYDICSIYTVGHNSAISQPVIAQYSC